MNSELFNDHHDSFDSQWDSLQLARDCDDLDINSQMATNQQSTTYGDPCPGTQCYENAPPSMIGAPDSLGDAAWPGGFGVAAPVAQPQQQQDISMNTFGTAVFNTISSQQFDGCGLPNGYDAGTFDFGLGLLAQQSQQSYPWESSFATAEYPFYQYPGSMQPLATTVNPWDVYVPPHAGPVPASYDDPPLYESPPAPASAELFSVPAAALSTCTSETVVGSPADNGPATSPNPAAAAAAPDDQEMPCSPSTVAGSPGPSRGSLSTTSAATARLATTARQPTRRRAQVDHLRGQWIAYTVKMRSCGRSYKEICEQIFSRYGVRVNISTLRGQFRTTTKPGKLRPRTPTWSRKDISLLFKHVPRHTNRTRCGKRDIKWKLVQEAMVRDGADFKFGFSTLAAMWTQLNRQRF